MIRDIGGVGTHPICGGSFNSPRIQGELWGEPLERSLPPKPPLRRVGGVIRCALGASLIVAGGVGDFDLNAGRERREQRSEAAGTGVGLTASFAPFSHPTVPSLSPVTPPPILTSNLSRFRYLI